MPCSVSVVISPSTQAKSQNNREKISVGLLKEIVLLQYTV